MNNESKLEVGDRVTVVSANYLKDRIGLSGRLAAIQGSHYYVTFDSDNKEYAFYESQLKKKAKGMQKSDLRTGMLVQLTNGIWHIVMLDHGCREQSQDKLIDSNGEWMSLGRYNDDFGYDGWYPDKYSIKQVATFNYLQDIFKHGLDKPEKFQGFTVIWTRENPKVKQLEDLVEKLQGQLKDTEGELKKIQEAN